MIVTVIFNVILPNETNEEDEIYLSSNLNAWNPKGTVLKRIGLNKVTAELKIDNGFNLEYKYTKGSWKTVEKDPEYKDIPNRALHVLDYENNLIRVDDKIINWPKGAKQVFEEAQLLKQNRGTWAQAEDKAREAIFLEPELGQAHLLLGELLILKWQREEYMAGYSRIKNEARAELENSIRLMPKDPRPIYMLCHLDLSMDAISPLYHKALSLPEGKSREFASSHWDFAITASKEGHKEIAINSFRRALSLNPKMIGLLEPTVNPAYTYWLEAKKRKWWQFWK